MAHKDDSVVRDYLPTQAPISQNGLPMAIGFSLMLTWHYLILFSPVFGDMTPMAPSFEDNYLFMRQLCLYVSIAICFCVIWLTGRHRMANALPLKKRSYPIYLLGLASVAVGALYVVASYYPLGIVVALASIGVLGMLQAYMMTLWMRCLMVHYSGHVLSSFGIYMVAGGSLAVLVCFFQWPITLVVAVAIPGISSCLLGYQHRLDLKAQQRQLALDEMQREAEDTACEEAVIETPSTPSEVEVEEAEGDQEDRSPSDGRDGGGFFGTSLVGLRNKRLLLFAGVFAFTFGLLQGAFIVTNIPIIIVNDAIVLIGIIFAGILIHLMPKGTDVTLSTDMMHRFSVILFVMGAVIIMWFRIGSPPMMISQILLLAGFNLFDFGCFVYGIEGYWSRQRQPMAADFARPVVYLCMATGLLIGFCILNSTESELIFETLLVVCGVCIMMVVATTLMPLFKLGIGREGSVQDADSIEGSCGKEVCPIIVSLSSFPTETKVIEGGALLDGSQPSRTPWRTACQTIAKRYRLSPRETEIFMLVAKGRNADYIQQKLVISTHTAKTHIANIYHKLAIHSAQELLDLVEECRDEDELQA